MKVSNQIKKYRSDMQLSQDELETQQETGKHPYQRFLMVLGVGLIALIVCLGFTICLWTNPAQQKEPVQTAEALVELARSEIPLSNAKDTNLQAVGRVDKDDKALLIIQAGDEAPYAYFPVTYESTNAFFRVTHIAEDGMSERVTRFCYSYQWENGYVILLNNEKCAKLRITNELGKEEWVEITPLPFLYYDEDAFADLNGDGKAETNYALFDKDGQELGF